MTPRPARKKAAARKPRGAAPKRGPGAKRKPAAGKKAVAKRKRAVSKQRPAAPKRAPAKRKSAARKRAPKPRHAPAAPKHVAPPRRTAVASARLVAVPAPARPPRPLASLAPGERAFGTALAGASARERVLFELRRARAALHAALKGLTPAGAGEPMGEGRWSAREVVLHLATRDQARLREMEAALRGVTPSWKDIAADAMDALNAETLAPIRHLGWEEALRLLELTREKLLEAIESVPGEPAEVWSPDHPFGWMLHGLPPHDRRHADAIKRWRTGTAG